MKFTRVDHQFSLFDYNSMRPKTKIKLAVSKERIEQAKAMFANKDFKGTAAILRELREGLDDYLERISNK